MVTHVPIGIGVTILGTWARRELNPPKSSRDGDMCFDQDRCHNPWRSRLEENSIPFLLPGRGRRGRRRRRRLSRSRERRHSQAPLAPSSSDRIRNAGALVAAMGATVFARFVKSAAAVPVVRTALSSIAAGDAAVVNAPEKAVCGCSCGHFWAI